jgi:hypothetical protein
MAMAIDRRQSLFIEMDNARISREHWKSMLISGMGFSISCLSYRGKPPNACEQIGKHLSSDSCSSIRLSKAASRQSFEATLPERGKI